MKKQTVQLSGTNTWLTPIQQIFLLNGSSKDKDVSQFSFRCINAEGKFLFTTNGSKAHIIKFPYTVTETPLYFQPKTWQAIQPTENDIPISKRILEEMLQLLPFTLIENSNLDVTKEAVNVLMAEVLHAVVSHYDHKYCLAYQYLLDFFTPFIGDRTSYTLTVQTGESEETHPVLIQLQKDEENPKYLGLFCLFRNFLGMKPLTDGKNGKEETT